MCSGTDCSNSSTEQSVKYQTGINDYSVTFNSLTPGGTYDITIFAVSNEKSSERATRQYTLGMCFMWIIPCSANFNMT